MTKQQTLRLEAIEEDLRELSDHVSSSTTPYLLELADRLKSVIVDINNPALLVQDYGR